MKLLSIKKFKDIATKVLKSDEPVLVKRRGEVAGIFFPVPLNVIPFEIKKDIFMKLTESIKKKLETKGIKEKEVLEDFENERG